MTVQVMIGDLPDLAGMGQLTSTIRVNMHLDCLYPRDHNCYVAILVSSNPLTSVEPRGSDIRFFCRSSCYFSPTGNPVFKDR